MSEYAFDNEPSNLIPIPLPIELPKPPDLSQLPAQVLHSGTVETLIGQNDDLMARLKVNIRRNAVLENQIIAFEKTNEELSLANCTMQSQLQIFEEKEFIIREKANATEASRKTLKDEIELLSAKLTEANKRIQNLQTAERYMRRIRKWVRPLIDRINHAIEKEQKQLLAKEAIISDLRARLSATINHQQVQESQFSRDQAKLVEQYELSQREMTGELEKIKVEAKVLREKASRLDHVTSEYAAVQNKNVYLEREFQEARTHADEYRRLSRAIAVEKAARENDLNEALTRIKNLEEERVRCLDQIESLQSVWAEAQTRLESSRLQQEALNRLNQELSRQLKETRQASPPPPPKTHPSVNN